MPGLGISTQTFQVQRDILERGCLFIILSYFTKQSVCSVMTNQQNSAPNFGKIFLFNV
nr:MAG TPA: hypothetical protein [Caudoviricetes sp.]